VEKDRNIFNGTSLNTLPFVANRIKTSPGVYPVRGGGVHKLLGVSMTFQNLFNEAINNSGHVASKGRKWSWLIMRQHPSTSVRK
jgi:hypothetical protein